MLRGEILNDMEGHIARDGSFSTLGSDASLVLFPNISVPLDGIALNHMNTLPSDVQNMES